MGGYAFHKTFSYVELYVKLCITKSHYFSQERDSVRSDQRGGSSSSQSITANVDLEVFTSIPSRERFVRSNRLPGDVLLARDRLLERLRGIQLTGRRFVIYFVHSSLVYCYCSLWTEVELLLYDSSKLVNFVLEII